MARPADELDPNLTLARADLAASFLKDKVKADRYADVTRQHICAAVTNVYKTPDLDQGMESQLLFGEPVDVLEIDNGWAWLQSVRDGYVGYIKADGVKMFGGDASPTHRVSNISTFVYPESTYKTTPLMQLSYGSQVIVVSEENEMCKLKTGGFVPAQHLAAIDFHADEIIAEAFRFLGTPYLWGGRSHQGLDCSSLVQLVLQANNFKCPRNSYMQEKSVGKAVDRDHVQSGDLVFFRGHVGLMVDDSTIIHANDRAMAVSIDDLDEYVHWRNKNGKSPVKMFKRVG